MIIFIADDHPLFREALKQMITGLDESACVTGVESFTGLHELLGAGDSVPDCLFMDLSMPGGNAWEQISLIHQRHPALPIIVITGSESAEDSRRAIEAGAVGFLSKSLDSASLERAVRAILSGNTMVIPSPHQTSAATSDIRHNSYHALVGKLTNRQKEVYRLICEGDTNKMIARKLDLTEGTVKLHVRAILQSLGVSNRTQAVGIAQHLDAD